MILPNRVIPGSTVDHLVKRIDWSDEQAVAYCGEEGEPVEQNTQEVCANCQEQLLQSDD